MAVDYDKLTASEKLELKLAAFEEAKEAMRISLREDGVPFDPREVSSLSDEEALGEWAELVVHSQMEDSEDTFSDREIDDLIAWEKKDPTKRQALFDVCIALSEKNALPKKLKEWLKDYSERENTPLTGRGRSPQRMYKAAIYAEVIGVAISSSQLCERVKDARLKPTRREEYGKVSTGDIGKLYEDKLSLCDAVMQVLVEFGLPRSYAYVEDAWKKYNRH